MLVCVADTLAIAELVIVYPLLCVVKRIYLILCVGKLSAECRVLTIVDLLMCVIIGGIFT